MSALERNTYQRIAASLRSDIDSGRLASGAFLPTERELQEQFAASRSTVRRALAHLVEAGYAQSVPNRGVVAVRNATPVTTGNVALIDHGSYVLRLMGIELARRTREEGLYLVHLGGSVEYPPEYALQTALDNKFAGALVWPYRAFPDAEFVRRVARDLPIVSLDHRQEGAETDLVTVDHEAAAAEATTQLIRQGCRRIAVTGMMDVLDITHQRFRGYLKALFAHDMQPQPADFCFTMTSGLVDPDPVPLMERLQRRPLPDGLLVLQDQFVPPTVETILQAGYSIPGDIKIATIGDDIDLTVDGIGMTAVSFDWNAMAEEALRLLLDRIATPNQPVRTRFVSHRLIVRGLCGAPPSEWSDPETLISTPSDRRLPRSRFQYSSPRPVPGDGPSHSSLR